MRKLYACLLIMTSVFWSVSLAQTQMDLPVTFDDPTVNYSTLDFGGNSSMFVVDPTDPTNMVVQSTKAVLAPEWSGTTLALPGIGFPPGTLNVDTGFLNPIPFSIGNTTMSVRVWSTAPGIPVRLKVEQDTDVTVSVETEATTTATMAWETLVFDFANEAFGTATINFASTYNETSIFYNFGSLGAGETFYWDDVQFGAGAPPMLAQMDLPVTFEDTSTVNYVFEDFGDNISALIVDPTDPTNLVVETTKPVTAPLWAGTTLDEVPGAMHVGFVNAIPFTATETTMTMRVWSPTAGTPIRIKAEASNNNTISVETEASTTVAMAWETLTFNFSNEVGGTAALNLANTYDMISVFFNFGTDGATAGAQTYYWDDVMFVTSAPPMLAQMDLPVTFDDTSTVNYATIDFGGTLSMFITDPTDPTNQVVQTEKTAGAVFWAGTTLAVEGTPPGAPNDLSFATAMPFTATETTLSVRIWAPAAGIPVMLKIEDQLNGAIFAETQDITAVANAWDTLYFDYSATTNGSFSIANTYDKVSLFYHFSDPAGVGTGQVFYWDDLQFGAGAPPMLAQMDLPVTFEDTATVNYVFEDFGDNISALIVDPTDPTNLVAETTKPVTAPLWAGTTLDEVPGAMHVGFINAIPFTATETTMTMRVWSPTAGTPIRIKAEASNNNTISVETEASTTVAMAWETLTFDFSNEAGGTAALNLANTYDMVSVFFNFGTDGATAGAQTYYWDDLQFGAGAPPMLAQMDLPVTFEDTATVNYVFEDFGDNISALIVDPTDPTNLVAETTKPVTAPLWAGITLDEVPGAMHIGFVNAIPFTATETTMTMRVWSPTAGTPIRIKAEASNNNTISVETEASTTVAMAWETLTFDFSNEAGGTAALNLANTYDMISVFFNFGTDGATAGAQTYYWDDLQFGAGAPPMLTQMDLPVTFEDTATVNYVFEDFGDNISALIVDPTDPTNLVAETTKPVTAPLWAGTTLDEVPGAMHIGFVNAIPFTATETTMTMRVWSPTAGTPIRIKAEASNNNTISVETEASTTVAMAWETLTFDFSNEAGGTAALNLANTYDMVSVFFNFGTDGATAGAQTYYWDDLQFGAGAPPMLAQMDLPVTFEDTATVNYVFEDFGDNISALIVDPTDPTNLVAETTKPVTAPLWAGTTLDEVPGAMHVGFINAIPFTATETTMTMRVWSPTAGTPIRIKAEASNNNTISVETEASTTVAMAWETLTFDFSNEAGGTAALNLANTYDMVSVFFNFGTDGATAGAQTYYWDDLQFGAGAPPMLAQMDLPVTFEDTATVNYVFEDFGDNISALIVDPTDPTNLVAETTKPVTAPLWAGTTLDEVPGAMHIGFINAIPFTATETTMTMRVWSPTAGTPIRIKAEASNNNTISVETEASTTVAMAWETLTFDFSNEAGGTAALNLANTYDMVSVFFNFGTDGATAGAQTYYWDDLQFGAGAPPMLAQMDLPVTFEDTATVNYVFEDFGDNISALIVDPTDPTNLVAETTKPVTAPLWAGTTLDEVPGAMHIGFINAIPFTATETTMTMRVWSPTAGTPIRIKAEASNNNTISVETEASTTVAMAWETLTFDFSNEAGGTAALNLANTYDMISVFFNFGTDGATAGAQTYYWDDLQFGAGAPPMLAQMDLPVTFEDTATVNYVFEDFGDNISALIVDPTDPTNLVAETTKPVTAPLWAGTTLDEVPGAMHIGFVNAIPFTATETTMTMRVWSPTAGTPIRIKAEASNNNTISVETEASTTVAMAWETLTFDFSNEAGGTAALNLANTYDMISVFFNFGTDGATAGAQTYYWDDLQFGAGAPPMLAQMDLPVTFEDTATVNYVFEDFGDNISALIVDPTDPTNLVAETTKPVTAPLWAGTTLDEVPGAMHIGFVNAIPFTATETTMTMRVWSPTAGTPIRIKAEASNNNTISVETEASTTVAMAWETLTFDFSNEAGGTAALNLANTYDMVSVFFNFGTDGATAGAQTYYWDDLQFGAGAPPMLAQMDLPVTFEDTATVNYVFEDFGDNISALIVDPTDPTNLVAETTKPVTAPLWAGTTLDEVPGAMHVGFINAIPFTATETTMTMRVWSPTAGTPIRIKAEASNNNTISVETEASTTVAMAWETLTFDFSNEAGGTAALNLANTYDMVSVFFNFGTDGATAGAQTYYWDDLQFGAGAPPMLAQMDLPVTFEDTATVNYVFEDFGDNISALIVDPTDPTNLVAETTKPVTAPLWAGTTLDEVPGAMHIGFVNAIPFTATETTMTMRVWSPTAGTPIRIKAEASNNNTISVETEASTTVAMAWETLTFDFSNEAGGTAALNLANTYDMVSVFFNFGTDGATAGAQTYYWDDLQFGAGAPPMLAQMDLPVTFEDTATVNYVFEDFGDNISALIVDPTDPTNLVAETTKPVTAPLWAGTTLDEVPGAMHIGFVNAIPFTATETTMTMRVWSPTAGTPIRIKAEASNNNTISVETEASTTVAMAWETLTFDFSNEAGGTAALNLANTYDMVSVFFNFGTDGATAGAQTYYWDDLQFGGATGGPCAGVMPDASILDDFECQGNINYTFANATWTEDVPNPNPTGLNTSAMVGEFIHWGAGTDGAFGGDLTLAPLDLTVSNGELKMDVHPSASGLPIIVVLQDGTGTDIEVQTDSTTVSGLWETLTYDFSASVASNDVSKIVIVVSPGDTVQHVIYFDNIRLDTVAVTAPCAGVNPDPSVFDDFECQGNITYTFANATWTENVVNPNPTGINSSSNVGEFIHWGAGTDGAFGGTLNLGPIDLSTYGADFKMDVHPSAVGLPIIAVFQDATGTEVANQTANTTVSGAWETLSFDMSAAVGLGDVTQVVFLVSPGDTVQHVVYFDNIMLDSDTVVVPCAGVVPDPNILDDFNCQGNITYTFANATWTEDVANPNPSGINTSTLVGEFIHWGAGTDGAFGGSLDLAPLDLSFLGSDLLMDVHPSSVGLPIIAVFQNAAGTEVANQTVNTTVSGAWERLTFDMSAAIAGGDVSNVVFLVSPGDTVQHVVYFDNIALDTSSIIGTCPGVTPDVDILEDFDCQRNTAYTFFSGTEAVVPNPDMSGINTSDNVRIYTRGMGAIDEIKGDLTLAPLDFATHNQMKLDVWDPSAPSVVTITLQDAAGIFLASATATTSVGNAWEELNFDFQTVPFTISVAKTIIEFDPGSTAAAGKSYYYDNMEMDGFVTGINDLTTTSLSLYPNPVSNFVTIDLSDVTVDKELIGKIISIDGKEVQTLSLNGNSDKEVIDVSGLSSGIYYIELTDTKTKWVGKFSKL